MMPLMAMGDGEIMGMIAMLCLFGWIPLKVLAGYRIRMAEIKARQGVEGDATRQALAEIRREVAALRETTTRFDISFDAALTKMEERVETLELRSTGSASESGALRTGQR